MFKQGDAVFFKKAKNGTKRSSVEIGFKGYGFGVFLGHVPPFQKDPPVEHLFRVLGTIGFLTFDNVAEFLGDEAAAKCVRLYEDKYYGKKMELVQKKQEDKQTEMPPEVIPPTPQLIGMDGKPIHNL
jgi:hypothetical protein